jgi:hypothetical protein
VRRDPGWGHVLANIAGRRPLHRGASAENG